jgi:hypothetical protein
MRSAVVLVLLTLGLLGCGGAEPSPSPAAPTSNDDVVSSPASHDPSASPDVGEPPRDCPFRVDQACYQTADDACTAISCPREQCQILESYPAQVRCGTTTP